MGRKAKGKHRLGASRDANGARARRATRACGASTTRRRRRRRRLVIRRRERRTDWNARDAGAIDRR